MTSFMDAWKAPPRKEGAFSEDGKHQCQCVKSEWKTLDDGREMIIREWLAVGGPCDGQTAREAFVYWYPEEPQKTFGLDKLKREMEKLDPALRQMNPNEAIYQFNSRMVGSVWEIKQVTSKDGQFVNHFLSELLSQAKPVGPTSPPPITPQELDASHNDIPF